MYTATSHQAARIERLRTWALHHGQRLGDQDQPRREALFLRALRATDPALSLAERRAIALVMMLQQVEIHLTDDDLLAGRFSSAPPEPEQARWHVECAEHQQALAVPAPQFSAAVTQGYADLHAALAQPMWFGGVGYGHHTVDFAAVLTRGLAALAHEAEQAAATHDDPAHAATSRAMAIALRGVIAFAVRHAELADELAAGSDTARAAELHRIAVACRRVPAAPATTFFEAVQAVWLVYLALGMSEAPCANSLGCPDRYLLPYFAVDGLSPEAAEELVAHFLIKCAMYADGQSLTLGGQDSTGGDATNDLTRIFWRVIARLHLPEPIIAVRMHEQMTADDLDAVVAITAAHSGHPSYYAEAGCRRLLQSRGIPHGEADGLAINSCMGVIVAGAELCDMWGAVLPLPLCMELALSGGRSADGTLLPTFADCADYPLDSIEAVFAAYQQVVARMAALMVERYRQESDHAAQYSPNPLLSGLLADCRTRGLDRMAGGPRYTSVIVEGFGWANVSDALLAIDTLVFQQRQLDLATFLQVVRQDYAGQEMLLRAVRACPKYGNGDPQADAMAVRVVSAFADCVYQQRQPGEHREYLPSLHTLHNHIAMGRACAVSLDGRRYGAPLNKQLGPSEWAATNGPTAVLTSAARIPTESLPGGQALDITLPPELLTTAAGRAQFTALLHTYFALGGADLQVNTVSPELLRAAQIDPVAHSHVLVRVGGYSDYFTKLDRGIQDDLIARTTKGL